ncbi:MAG: UDP-N-acetylmuramoyl-tripeptide--D-alanyl-D-alanine ligase [Weeksellaceae bacterium]
MNLEQLYQIYLKSSGVCTDTRKLSKDNLYIALKGDKFDGNKFAKQAIKDGAIAAIVDDKNQACEDENVYFVEDGLRFLQHLAKHHRRQLKLPIIALTGSNGKTTTKELIATTLSKKFKVCYTQGNLNNHIGVPLTLLDIDSSHDLAVVEMGANHLHEIDQLCAIAEPDYGYITNFGKAHLEGFGGFKGVIQGKSEMYAYLKTHHKTVFVNTDDPIQVNKTMGMNTITFGFDSDATYNFHRSSEAGHAGISYQGKQIMSQLAGEYNENNMAAATTIALHFGVEIHEIISALKEYHPKLNRSQELEKSGHKLLLDAYNANPTSMELALKNFHKANGKKCIILGDMFELGETSDAEHQAISDLAISLNFDEIYLIGTNFSSVKAKEEVKQFMTREDFIQHIKTNPIKADNILIKGSRGVALEKIVEFI